MSGETVVELSTEDLLRRNLPEWERSLVAAERRVEALRSMISGAKVMLGRSAVVKFDGTEYEFRSRPLGAPRGTAAFLAIMGEAPRRFWKLVEIRRELLSRGWAPSSKSIDASAKRCLELGKVKQPRYGYYCLPEALEDLPDSAETLRSVTDPSPAASEES